MLGIGLCNIAVGKLLDASKGTEKPYASVILFFTILGCVSVGLSILLKCVDTVRGNRLYAGQRDRESAAEREAEIDHETMVNSPNTALQGLLSPSATAGVGSQRR